MQEVTGSLRLDYTGETYHDIYADEAYRAMQITLERDDIDLGGGVHPSVTIVMPTVSFTNRTPDRPIDDIVTEAVEFAAHYDDTEGYGIRATVVNTAANYS
jgi:hypothetical protein